MQEEIVLNQRKSSVLSAMLTSFYVCLNRLADPPRIVTASRISYLAFDKAREESRWLDPSASLYALRYRAQRKENEPGIAGDDRQVL
jgi:hypothetical protein